MIQINLLDDNPAELDLKQLQQKNRVAKGENSVTPTRGSAPGRLFGSDADPLHLNGLLHFFDEVDRESDDRREATQFAPGRWHGADAAVAILEDYVDLGGGGRMVVSAPTAGTLVVKKGVTTDVTRGVVVSTSFGLSVELAGCPIWFRNQIAVRPAPGSAFSAPGDSGSWVCALGYPWAFRVR